MGSLSIRRASIPIATSGTETYAITVGDAGTQDVTGIRLRDTLPADTHFLSVIADPDHGFTCAHDGSPTGGVIECIGGHLRGTESEFYTPPGGTPAPLAKEDLATITIKVFARPHGRAMHNEVRVDPLNEIAEYDELNNLATQDTDVTNGGFKLSAYNELKIKKEQTSPRRRRQEPNRRRHQRRHRLDADDRNDATDPVGQSAPVVVKDTLPRASATSRRRTRLRLPPAPASAFQCVQGANVQEVTCTAGGPMSGLVTCPSTASPVTRTITLKAFAAGHAERRRGGLHQPGRRRPGQRHP